MEPMESVEIKQHIVNNSLNSDCDEMETDDEDKLLASDDNAEDGEIIDNEDKSSEKPINSALALAAWRSRKERDKETGETPIEANVSKEHLQSKLEERAKRFAEDSSNTKPLVYQQYQDLYKSLHMKKSEISEKFYRLNALHMRGTEEMNTQDVFHYFKDYNPASIEWINDYCCNVVWLDDEAAAKALLGLSVRIKGLRRSGHTNPFRVPKSYSGSDDSGGESKSSVSTSDEDEQLVQVRRGNTGKEDYARITDIRIPIPPGFWRKGVACPKAKTILLRFATRADKKVPEGERINEHLVIGDARGLITKSRKRRFQNALGNILLFEDDQGDARDFEDADLRRDNKNPWGSLAQSWNRIDKSRQALRDLDAPASTVSLKSRNRSPSPVKIQEELKSLPTKSVFHRIGSTLIPVAKKYASDDSMSDSDEDRWTRKRKAPRMRMYADEVVDKSEKRITVVHSKDRSPALVTRVRKHRAKHELDLEPRESLREDEKHDEESWESGYKSKEPLQESPEDLRNRLEKDDKSEIADIGGPMLIWARLDSPEVSQKGSDDDDDDDNNNEDDNNKSDTSSNSGRNSSSSKSNSGSSSSSSSDSDSSSSSSSSSESSDSDSSNSSSSSSSSSEDEQEETPAKERKTSDHRKNVSSRRKQNATKERESPNHRRTKHEVDDHRKTKHKLTDHRKTTHEVPDRRRTTHEVPDRRRTKNEVPDRRRIKHEVPDHRKTIDSRRRKKHEHSLESDDDSRKSDDTRRKLNSIDQEVPDFRKTLDLRKQANVQDLRTKLNMKKLRRENLESEENIDFLNRSPLRIEIDNDEYYRLIGSDQE